MVSMFLDSVWGVLVCCRVNFWLPVVSFGTFGCRWFPLELLVAGGTFCCLWFLGRGRSSRGFLRFCVASLIIHLPLGFRSPNYSRGMGAIVDGSLRTSEIGSPPAARNDSERPPWRSSSFDTPSIKCFGSLGTLGHFVRVVASGIWRRTPGSSSYWR